MRPDVLLDIPWRKVMQGYFAARQFLYTKDPPDNPGLVIRDLPGEAEKDITPKDVAREFAKASYNTKWMFSYNYRGEDLNVRIEYYDGSFKWPFRQLHIRGFSFPDGMFLMPHEEVSPDGDNRFIPTDQISHQRAHLKGKEQDHERGYDMTKDELSSMGMFFEEGYTHSDIETIEKHTL